MPKTRTRRTAEGAKEEILEAAERRLATGGPGALRLQELAADVGVSHPAILHHFGSREGLVRAVVDRAVQRLQADLVQALAGGDGAPPHPAGLLDRVADTLGPRGHARLMAWLVLSGYEPLQSAEVRRGWKEFIRATHAMRTAAAPPGTRPADEEDTAFTLALSAMVLFADAIVGPATFEAAGLGRGPAVRARFRAWLGALLAEHYGASPR